MTNSIALIDVDNTLIIDGMIIGESIVNERLLQALAVNNVTEIYLFSTMSMSSLQKDLSEFNNPKFRIPIKPQIIRKLQEHGLNVIGIITPCDPVYNHGLGAAYNDFYKPLYESFNPEGKNDLEVQENYNLFIDSTNYKINCCLSEAYTGLMNIVDKIINKTEPMQVLELLISELNKIDDDYEQYKISHKDIIEIQNKFNELKKRLEQQSDSNNLSEQQAWLTELAQEQGWGAWIEKLTSDDYHPHIWKKSSMYAYFLHEISQLESMGPFLYFDREAENIESIIKVHALCSNEHAKLGVFSIDFEKINEQDYEGEISAFINQNLPTSTDDDSDAYIISATSLENKEQVRQGLELNEKGKEKIDQSFSEESKTEEFNEGELKALFIIRTVIPKIIDKYFKARARDYSGHDEYLFGFFTGIVSRLAIQTFVTAKEVKEKLDRTVFKQNKGKEKILNPDEQYNEPGELSISIRLENTLNYIWNETTNNKSLRNGRKSIAIQKIYAILSGEKALLDRDFKYIIEVIKFNHYFMPGKEYAPPAHLDRIEVFKWVVNYLIDDCNRKSSSYLSFLWSSGRSKHNISPTINENLSGIIKKIVEYAERRRIDLTELKDKQVLILVNYYLTEEYFKHKEIYLTGHLKRLIQTLTYLGLATVIIYNKKLNTSEKLNPLIEHFEFGLSNLNMSLVTRWQEPRELSFMAIETPNPEYKVK